MFEVSVDEGDNVELSTSSTTRSAADTESVGSLYYAQVDVRDMPQLEAANSADRGAEDATGWAHRGCGDSARYACTRVLIGAHA
ncbi:hypothetical protein V499_07053 [Pseudogymnoascus sp. VKM F-103]|nr:hypothetical protein V499_07053 [Pseudogymnoascus sp. VKM F-103]